MVLLWHFISKLIVLKSFEQIYKYIQKASDLNHIYLFLLTLNFHDQIYLRKSLHDTLNTYNLNAALPLELMMYMTLANKEYSFAINQIALHFI